MMTGKNTGPASKGSRLHIQNLINRNYETLNKSILSLNSSLNDYAAGQPSWVSPLQCDSYREYRGSTFLKVLGLSDLKQDLKDFWPHPDPSWDALATITGNDRSRGVILLEAKSHIKELGNPSYSCHATGKGLGKITSSLSTVKNALGVEQNHDWLSIYYQYANRLAHIYWLNVVAKVPAWLVLLFFTGDQEQGGPNTDSEWIPAINQMDLELGLPERHRLSNKVIRIFHPI